MRQEYRPEAKESQERLWDILMGFVASQALYACVELNLFTQLTGRALTLAQVAEAAGIDSRTAERLLTPMVALGLVTVEQGHYSNTEVADLCLVKGKPHYFGDMVSYYINNFYPAAGQILESARKGEPVIAHWQALRSREEIARSSTLAMDNLSRDLGVLLAGFLDLSPAKRLLDIGGGSGAVGRALAERYAGLEAVVLDQPLVLKIAQEIWASSSALSRFKPYPGDFVRDELPAGFDVAIASNIVHLYGAGVNQKLMEKIFHAINPGGVALVIDFYLDEAKTGPLFPALFGLGASLMGKGPRTYSPGDVRSWMEASGFQDIGYRNLTRLVGCVMGWKPGAKKVQMSPKSVKMEVSR